MTQLAHTIPLWRRIGQPLWRLGREAIVRQPDDLTGCVFFINTLRNKVVTGLSTGFFIAKGTTESRGLLYAVTAAHCLTDKDGEPDDIVLLLNQRNGPIFKVLTKPSEWIRHYSADIAILPMPSLDLERFDYSVVMLPRFAESALRDDKSIGYGDEVYVVGLLVHLPGTARIMPINRQGSVAAMPDDSLRLKVSMAKVNAGTVTDQVALVEMRSIGGLSGSPVFLHLPIMRDAPPNQIITTGPQGLKAYSGGETLLLGVMHGFLPVGKEDPDAVSGGREDLNTGIAVVTFIDRVMDILNSQTEVERFMTAKRQHEEFEAQENMPVPTATQPRSEDRLSLAPLDPEEALKAMLNAPRSGVEDD